MLGVIQGLTEFLPVSSSAHLIFVREVLGWGLLDDPHWNMIFDVSAHAGTFAALVAYFWADIRQLVWGFGASLRGGIGSVPERRLAWVLVVATIPGGVAGWLGQDTIEGVFRRAPMALAALLVVFGLILWAADRRGRKERELGQVGWLDGVLMGCAQALALAPGVSRSGVTMTAGLLRGLTREAAARFSFLLSLPIIAGALFFGVEEVMTAAGGLPAGSLAAFALGFASAAVSGYFCIRYFLSYLQRRALAPFVVYRVAVGVFLLVWFAVSSIQGQESPVRPRRRPLRGDGGEGRRVVATDVSPGMRAAVVRRAVRGEKRLAGHGRQGEVGSAFGGGVRGKRARAGGSQ